MPPSKQTKRLLALFAVLFLAALPFVILTRAITPPPKTEPWLTHLVGESSPEIAQAYYATIDAPPTLDEWLTRYGFDNNDEIHAVYYNAADLGFGRDMHCREGTDFIACVVGNYGLGPAGPAHIALQRAIAGEQLLASVAMVYEKRGGVVDPAPGNENNRVTFYIYDGAGQLIPAVPLDSEGEKYLPHMCLACHGGKAIVDEVGGVPVTVTVTGANFLPFDLFSFGYSAAEGYTQTDQAEALRRLNALVYQTTPPPAVSELIDGLYPGGVMNPGSTADETFIPADWNGTATERAVYADVVKPYCRTCHVAHFYYPPNPTTIQIAEFNLFSQFNMPHAELTFKDFWRYGDPGTPAAFARNMNVLAGTPWSTVVNSTSDAAGNCAGGDCALRAAIILANGAGEKVITFHPDTDGAPITLSLTGGGPDTPSVGDLDLTFTGPNPLLILGNGVDKTIIDGGEIDRVFDIAPDAVVYMQALTIRGGATAEGGGGIRNQGNLILNDVLLVANSAGSGGGIANTGDLTLEDSGVISNTAVSGAGISSSGHFTLTTTTVSGNGGGAVHNSGQLSISYSTIYGGGTGLQNVGGTAVMAYSALAGGVSCSGTIESGGYNLLENSTGCTVTGDIVTLISDTPARLAPLAIPDGGSTPAHLPLPGSPLLDGVPVEADPFAFVSLADQHGTLRPQLLQNDIGAVERLSVESIYLPQLQLGTIIAPDLHVVSLSAAADAFSIVIENQGNAPSVDPFWVDLYIDPAMAPTAVNQIWPDLSDEGLVWGVTDPIPPGGTLILTYSADPDQTHLYYNDEQSRYGGDLPPGTPIYAQVDSYHPDTDYGSVREGDEMGGGGYNNISGGISSRIITLPEVGFPAADSGPPADRGLPPR